MSDLVLAYIKRQLGIATQVSFINVKITVAQNKKVYLLTSLPILISPTLFAVLFALAYYLISVLCK